MKLIVGLGNPGTFYAGNRHNAGFMCVSKLAKETSAAFDKKEGAARTAHAMIAGAEVVLARPQTYMNESGEAVIKLMQKYRLTPDDLIVIHDDLDLKPGQLRVRLGGSSGGHKGIESIIAETGSPNFTRVRIGIGHPRDLDDDYREVVEYVLSDFTREEAGVMEETITRAAQATVAVITDGLNAAMDRFNPKPGGKKAKEEPPAEGNG